MQNLLKVQFHIFLKWFRISKLSNMEATHFCLFSFPRNFLRFRFDSFEFKRITGKPDSEASGHNELPLMAFLSSNWAISFYETRGPSSLLGKVYPDLDLYTMDNIYTHFQLNPVTFFERTSVTKLDQTHKSTQTEDVIDCSHSLCYCFTRITTSCVISVLHYTSYVIFHW